MFCQFLPDMEPSRGMRYIVDCNSDTVIHTIKGSSPNFASDIKGILRPIFCIDINTHRDRK